MSPDAFELHTLPDFGPDAMEGAQWVEVWKPGHFPRRSHMSPQGNPVALSIFVEPGETPREAVEAAWDDCMSHEAPTLESKEWEALRFAALEMGIIPHPPRNAPPPVC